MDAEWLTYSETAERLGSNIEAVRQRAIRCRWPRVLGNDGQVRFSLSCHRPSRQPFEGAYRSPLATPYRSQALEAHVSEARSEKVAVDYAEREARTVAAFAAAEAPAEREAEKAKF
jgi:hypothetical protein